MSTTGSVNTITCANCGFADGGNYCSNCGAELNKSQQSSVKIAAESALGLSSHGGIILTFFRILRSPTRAIIRHVDDITYRGHRTFFLFGLGLTAVMFSLLPSPDSAGPVDGLADRSNLIAQLLQHYSTELQYAYFIFSYLLMFLIGYFIFPRFATAHRTANEYWKLFCLFYGFSFFLVLIGLVPLVALTKFAQFSAVSVEVPKLAALAFAIALFAIVIYTFVVNLRVQKQFWGISYFKAAIGVMVSGFVATMTMQGIAYALSATVNHLARV